MPLDLLTVSNQVRQMGQLLSGRRVEEDHRRSTAQEMVAKVADAWEELAERAEKVRERVAIPTGALNEHVPPPPRIASYTALATDGSEIDPDRHGAGGDYYVINIGHARVPYGQPGREVELRSHSTIGYSDDDLYIVDPRDSRRQVPVRDRHLDARRTVCELGALASLADKEVAQHGDVPIVALIDGTLLFSVLEERPRDFLRGHFYAQYVAELDSLQQGQVALAAYASRTRGIDVVNLMRIVCGAEPGACDRCETKGGPSYAAQCAFRGLTDAQLLGHYLGPWERSAVFRVRSNVHDPYYGQHRVYFFLLNVGREIARVEMPEWVARDPRKRAWVHSILVDQCAKGFGYPAVLARADDRAVLTTGDHVVLENLVRQEMARHGMSARVSAKLNRKQVRTV